MNIILTNIPLTFLDQRVGDYLERKPLGNKGRNPLEKLYKVSKRIRSGVRPGYTICPQCKQIIPAVFKKKHLEKFCINYPRGKMIKKLSVLWRPIGSPEE
jgi:hypothetical protein